jgi:hypothetical protein
MKSNNPLLLLPLSICPTRCSGRLIQLRHLQPAQSTNQPASIKLVRSIAFPRCFIIHTYIVLFVEIQRCQTLLAYVERNRLGRCVKSCRIGASSPPPTPRYRQYRRYQPCLYRRRNQAQLQSVQNPFGFQREGERSSPTGHGIKA